ncbi:MAG: biotin--[acetyl-CoA-carboxylase] ligase [Fusobacterium sp.]|nr:biotin--[acetyl-CoA-carboxylase] ligase [Fusobacterium sp.]
MKLKKFKELDSTNNFMKENYKIFENYDIISAENQTSGRGRRGNTWLSSKGMALFSFFLKEQNLSMEEYTKIPMIAGIATLSALNKIEKNDYQYKWTNDVFLKGKKICGILVEKVENNFIVGIGININNDIPEAIEDIAISLNKDVEIDKIILKVVEEFSKYYEDFLLGNWEKILQEINLYNFLKNKKIKIKILDKFYDGIARNISVDGRLEVEIDKKIKLFSVGEIELNYRNV